MKIAEVRMLLYVVPVAIVLATFRLRWLRDKHIGNLSIIAHIKLDFLNFDYVR